MYASTRRLNSTQSQYRLSQESQRLRPSLLLSWLSWLSLYQIENKRISISYIHKEKGTEYDELQLRVFDVIVRGNFLIS